MIWGIPIFGTPQKTFGTPAESRRSPASASWASSSDPPGPATEFSTASNSNRSTSPWRCSRNKEAAWNLDIFLRFHCPCPKSFSNDSPRYRSKSFKILVHSKQQAPTSSVMEWWSASLQPRRYTLSQHVETIANLRATLSFGDLDIIPE